MLRPWLGLRRIRDTQRLNTQTHTSAHTHTHTHPPHTHKYTHTPHHTHTHKHKCTHTHTRTHTHTSAHTHTQIHTHTHYTTHACKVMLVETHYYCMCGDGLKSASSEQLSIADNTSIELGIVAVKAFVSSKTESSNRLPQTHFLIMLKHTSTSLICGATATTLGTVKRRCRLDVSFLFSRYMFIIRCSWRTRSSRRHSAEKLLLATRYG